MSSTTINTYPLRISGLGSVDAAVSQRGSGQPILVLHGGAGPQSVTNFADHLASTLGARVITPTHPGFGGTPRPEALTTVRELAVGYLSLLDQLDLTDVTVIGNSMGGWIASEMALLGSARLARVVLVGATGIDVADHPVADVHSLTLDEVMQLSFHDAEPFRVDPSTLSDAARSIAAANRAALAVYSGTSGADPSLRERLTNLDLATLVLWGESDQIVEPDYGRAYAAAIPGAQFELLKAAGHMPHLETPEQLIAALSSFIEATPAWTHEYSVETTVAPKDIWTTLKALYTGTKLSDRGDTIEIHGPFAPGTSLSATPPGADFVISCTIVELIEGSVFGFRSNFNGLTITARFELAPLAGGGTRITQNSTIAGPRAEILGPQIGPRITEDHPDAMADLLAAAESRSRGR